MYEDRKFQDGDYVIYNSHSSKNPDYEERGTILRIHDPVGIGKRGGDYAYTFESKRGQKYIWGYHCTNAMMKYNPDQTGDRDDDI